MGLGGVNAIGQLVTVAQQLVSVPLFLSYWGGDKYGEWILANILTIFMTAGVAMAGGTEMILASQRSGQQAVVSLFHGFQAVFVILWLALLGSASLFVFSGASFWLGFDSITPVQLNALAIVFTVQAGLQLAYGVVLSGFRVSHEFSRGFAWYYLGRLVAFAAQVAALVVDGRVVAIAVWYGLGLAVPLFFMIWDMKRRVPWLSFGVAETTWDSIRSLFKPALGDLLLPLSQSARSQGLLIVVATIANPATVAMVGSLRTLSSTVIQGTRFVSESIQQELSVAFAEQSASAYRRLHRLLLGYSLTVALLGGVGLAIAGEPLFQIWTRGELPFSWPVLGWLLMGTTLNVIWGVDLTLARSINSHLRFVLAFVLCISVAYAIGMNPIWPLSVVAVAACAAGIDLSMCVYCRIRLSSILMEVDSGRSYAVKSALVGNEKREIGQN